MSRTAYTGIDSIDYINQAGLSGDYTTQYLNAFYNYGTPVELTYWQALPYSGVMRGGSGLGLKGSGAWPWSWMDFPPASGIGYYTSSNNFDYVSGVIYSSKSFIDYTQLTLDIASSTKKSLNKNQVYGVDIEKGKAYFSPDMVFTQNSAEFYVTYDGVMWAKANNPLQIRDVWTITIDRTIWHVVMPKPRFLAGQIVFYEADIQKVGILNYNPWGLVYMREIGDPVTGSGYVRNSLAGGFYFPLDGGFY